MQKTAGKRLGQSVSTYHITMDDNKLGIGYETLAGMYSAIDSKARALAPMEIRGELIITQDGRNKSRFYITISNRMAPYFITAIQQHIESEYGIGLRSYFQKLQEQIMSQMFAGAKDVVTISPFSSTSSL